MLSAVCALPSGGALLIDGPASAVPVLFLHGVAGGAWSWRPQRADLAAGYRTYTWEARGHGDTPRVADAGLSEYYQDATEALAVIVEQERRPAFVVGHSMGGLLAMALACNVGGGVAGLFLVDPVYATGEEAYGHAGMLAGLMRVLAEPVIGSIQRNGRIAQRISRWMFENSFENRAHMEAAWPDQLTQVPLEYPKMLREAFDRPSGFPLRDFAKEIGDPTFVMEGSVGRKRPRFPRLVDTLRARLGTNFSYETIPGGHYLQLDQPDIVTKRLREFLARYAG